MGLLIGKGYENPSVYRWLALSCHYTVIILSVILVVVILHSLRHHNMLIFFFISILANFLKDTSGKWRKRRVHPSGKFKYTNDMLVQTVNIGKVNWSWYMGRLKVQIEKKNLTQMTIRLHASAKKNYTVNILAQLGKTRLTMQHYFLSIKNTHINTLNKQGRKTEWNNILEPLAHTLLVS